MAEELAYVYAIGSDMDLRSACYPLLEQKIALAVDLLEHAALYLDEKQRRKVSSSKRMVGIVAPRAQVEEILARLKANVPAVKAYAVPVIASI